MPADHHLSAVFAAERDHLLAVARRMLGDAADAEDAVQETWLRAQRADRGAVANLPAWLTTVTSRVCLDRLRARARQPGPTAVEPLPLDDAVVEPEAQAVLVEEVGRALLVVLDRLTPSQRVAFVLHDLFGLRFDEVAVVLDRSEVATKKLASRARHRVRGGAAPPTTVERHEHVALVEAFLAAARGGDVTSLLRLLAPDVVRRSAAGTLPTGTATVLRGADAVAGETRALRHRAAVSAVVLVDGAPAIAVAPGGRLRLAIRLVIDGGRITEVEVVSDPDRLRHAEVAVAAWPRPADPGQAPFDTAP